MTFILSSQPSPSLQHEPALQSHTCHIIEAYQSVKGSNASHLSGPEPPLTSVGVAPTYLSIVLGNLCIPAVNDSEGEGFIHIQYFIFSHLSYGVAKLKWCGNGSCLG